MKKLILQDKVSKKYVKDWFYLENRIKPIFEYTYNKNEAKIFRPYYDFNKMVYPIPMYLEYTCNKIPLINLLEIE